ncbi:hypothetical protein DMH04_11015 [Kibdelosporangium aridum]|uniref:Uncharacterized protein n=1 Tax=Kibdelosporangium aridum TaxID=2030 RepID=A0A428ZHF6_KIBAR|nr:hypothetical protein [Kibdelosporangium aridum]RSM87536.1 hypothetical protein DMH04_11015 [Kibdelosporangium aridum]
MGEQNKSKFEVSQVAAAALASVTAAVVGSTLGVAGTVLGAALGAVITTVATELYSRSYERVVTSRKVRWQWIAGASVAAFAVGVIALTAVEQVRGQPFSGDSQTTIGGVLQQPVQRPRNPAPPPSSTSTTTVTVTPTRTAAPSATVLSPPPISGSSTTTTTTTTSDTVQSSVDSRPPEAP